MALGEMLYSQSQNCRCSSAPGDGLTGRIYDTLALDQEHHRHRLFLNRKDNIKILGVITGHGEINVLLFVLHCYVCYWSSTTVGDVPFWHIRPKFLISLALRPILATGLEATCLNLPKGHFTCLELCKTAIFERRIKSVAQRTYRPDCASLK